MIHKKERERKITNLNFHLKRRVSVVPWVWVMGVLFQNDEYNVYNYKINSRASQTRTPRKPIFQSCCVIFTIGAEETMAVEEPRERMMEE